MDPAAAEFQRSLAEKRADARRLRGREAKPIGQAVAELDRRPPKPARRRRIPDAEQARTFALLRAVPELDEGDARDLARLAPLTEFQRVLPMMRGNIRNPGGWLRRAVSDGWTDGRHAAGGEPRR